MTIKLPPNHPVGITFNFIFFIKKISLVYRKSYIARFTYFWPIIWRISIICRWKCRNYNIILNYSVFLATARGVRQGQVRVWELRKVQTLICLPHTYDSSPSSLWCKVPIQNMIEIHQMFFKYCYIFYKHPVTVSVHILFEWLYIKIKYFEPR